MSTKPAQQSKNASATRRGRPRSEKKARNILNAATDLFTRNGFEATSVDDIAAAAAVSKQTVYSHFGSKEELFGVAISAKCKRSGIDAEDIDLQAPPEDMLPELARRFIALITSDEAVAVNAICSVSCESHPELGRLYYERGPVATVEAVAAYLASQNEAGQLRIEEPMHAAWQFLGMLKAETQMRAQFHLELPAAAEQERYVASCVTMFLRAYAA
jgi:AcrR family transcriptional regulator